MLLLVVIAFVSTGSFFRIAREHGSHPGRAASTPIVGLAAVLITNHFASKLLTMALARFEVAVNFQSTILFIYSLFLILAYLVFLRKNADAIMSQKIGAGT